MWDLETLKKINAMKPEDFKAWQDRVRFAQQFNPAIEAKAIPPQPPQPPGPTKQQIEHMLKEVESYCSIYLPGCKVPDCLACKDRARVLNQLRQIGNYIAATAPRKPRLTREQLKAIVTIAFCADGPVSAEDLALKNNTLDDLAQEHGFSTWIHAYLEL
jgi:hypothetical protein